MSQSQIQNMIHSSIESLVSESQQVDQTQKTNLEESSAATSEEGHKSHHKKHHKNKHHHEDAAVQVAAPKFISQVAPNAPAASNLVKVDSAVETAHPTLIDVPIDEVQAINLQVNTLYNLDTIESVTLKSFRKVVGYDTFNSILKGNRDETKDMSDHYNITMTVMVKRDPETAHTPPPADVFDGGKTLSKIIDKGFPYDDGDNSIEDQTPKWSKKKTDTPINVGKLNGENVTKQALVALVKDTDAPITQGLVQLDEMKSDADGLFKLMDANVTRGNLKNLVTDKPSPITVGLAQKSDADGLFKLMDANVTRGNLKNLVTDKPSPITVGLAQKSDADGLFKLMDANVTRGNLKNLVTDKPSPITVGLAQKSDADGLFKLMDANVTRGNLKNLVTDKPSPITVGLAQKSDADGLFKLMDANVTRGNLKNLVTDKPSPITVGLAQTSNPVVNPPYNNWSVNQPSPPHDSGYAGKESMGQNIIVDGHNVSY